MQPQTANIIAQDNEATSRQTILKYKTQKKQQTWTKVKLMTQTIPYLISVSQNKTYGECIHGIKTPSHKAQVSCSLFFKRLPYKLNAIVQMFMLPKRALMYLNATYAMSKFVQTPQTPAKRTHAL